MTIYIALLATACLWSQSAHSDTGMLRSTPNPAPAQRASRSASLPVNSEVRPLKAPLVMSVTLLHSQALSSCQSIPSVVAKLKQKHGEAQQVVGEILSTPHPGIKDHSGFYSNFAGRVKQCCAPNQSLSVEKQKAAGCKVSDTISTCMGKITQQCIKASSSYYYVKKTDIQQIRNRLNKASQALKELAQAQEQLSLIVP